MFGSKKYNAIRIISAITFVIMVAVNALANILPINEQTTGEISDFYANLFAPAGYTFSIWGLIYILLLAYTIYQLGFFNSSKVDMGLLDKIGILFIISSIANSIWIFAWHYNIIWLSLLLIIVVLISLILINKETSKINFTIKESIFVRTPFSIYFGWITVATIANVTTFLVSVNWNGFGISDEIWTVAVLLVGFLISSSVIVKNRSLSYGLTIIWAYTGILMKHLSKNGFGGEYPSIISAVSIFIIFLVIVIVYMLFKEKKKSIYS